MASSKGKGDALPAYTAQSTSQNRIGGHKNAVIEAANLRSQTEQQMQNLLQMAQLKAGIYNPDIDPEHDVDWYCSCYTCNYKRAKWGRLDVHKKWSHAVMYPGERRYHDVVQAGSFMIMNPYYRKVISPYGWSGGSIFRQTPSPRYYAMSVRQTIKLNNELNVKAQANVDALEPTEDIWATRDNLQEGSSSSAARLDASDLASATASMSLSSNNGGSSSSAADKKRQLAAAAIGSKSSGRFSGLKRMLSSRSSEQSTSKKQDKSRAQSQQLRDDILKEEAARWPDAEWRQIVMNYQAKVGMTRKIADLRARQPLQYLHLLRAGYFEPIPVAWADQMSNPLKFSIEPAGGWRGITPTWRGYEDTAEERLYWVLNHRDDVQGARLKPDQISALELATKRMASAVEPPPQYFAADDICHVMHTSTGYSRQVMPPPFVPADRPEVPTDDTMILLDISGSMDFEPQRPVYDGYLITGYASSTQPKNKDVAKAIFRRFTDAMANHDHLPSSGGYDLVTFSSHARHEGKLTHQNLEQVWSGIRMGGGTRVMTGWQKVKDLHFRKHQESATWHPIYGWQAGPETPMLRLLLILDGEATDMDEFELDLLGLSWAHVTIFLVGVEGDLHHHRHGNELQRISDVNHHVSFVDAQGNAPERFVTHELLKRHLGLDLSLDEFQQLELPPRYDV